MLVDGRPFRSYGRAYVQGGRVFIPLAQVILRLADRAWFEDDVVVLQHNERLVRIRIARSNVDALNTMFVPAGPVLRALGDDVSYDAGDAELEIRTRLRLVALPTPYVQPATPIAPSAVFTPSPPTTPRPMWSGSPSPRRTPLPVPPRDRYGAVLSGLRSGATHQ